MAIGRFTRDLKGPAVTPELGFEEAMFVPMQRKAEKDKLTDALFAIDTGVLATEQDKAGILNDITNDYNTRIENVTNSISGNNANLYDARKQVLSLNKDVAQAKNTGIYYQATKYYTEREEAKKNFFDAKSGQNRELLNSKWNEWQLEAEDEGKDGAYDPNTGELITAHSFPSPPISQDHTSHLASLATKAGTNMKDLAGAGLRVDYTDGINDQGQPVRLPVVKYDPGDTIIDNTAGLEKFVEYITAEYQTKGNAFGEDWDYKGNRMEDIVKLATNMAGIVSSQKTKSNEQVSFAGVGAALEGKEVPTPEKSLLQQANMSGANIGFLSGAGNMVANLNKTLGQNIDVRAGAEYDPQSLVDAIQLSLNPIPILGNTDDETYDLGTRQIGTFQEEGEHKGEWKVKDTYISNEQYEALNRFADPLLIMDQKELSFITKYDEKMFDEAVQEFIDTRKADSLKQQLKEGYNGSKGATLSKKQVKGLALQDIIKDNKKLVRFVDKYEREVGNKYAFGAVGLYPEGSTAEDARRSAALKREEEKHLYYTDSDNKTTPNNTTLLYPFSNPSGDPITPAKLLDNIGDTNQMKIIGAVASGNPSQLTNGFLIQVGTDEGTQYYVMPAGGLQQKGTPEEEYNHNITRGAFTVAENVTTIPNIRDANTGTVNNLEITTTRHSADNWDVRWNIVGPDGTSQMSSEFETNNPASILTQVENGVQKKYTQIAGEEEVKKKDNPLTGTKKTISNSGDLTLTTISREGNLRQEALENQLEPWEQEVRNNGGGVAVLTKSFGNLRPNNSNPYKSGVYKTGSSGRYQTFDSYDSGLKGLIWDVKAKQFKGGLSSRAVSKGTNTLDALKIWAPSTDNNNPDVYAKSVLSFINDELGTDYTTDSSFSELPTSQLVESIIKQEDIRLYEALKSDGFFEGRIDLYAANIRSDNRV